MSHQSINVHLKKKKSKLVNFCGAILLVKMEENRQYFQYIMLIISRKVKAQRKRKKRSVQKRGEGAVTDWKCQKWFAKFRAGDFSLDDAPQSGRPLQVHSDQTENNQSSTMHETADIIKISQSTKLLVKMKSLQKKLNKLFGQPNINNPKFEGCWASARFWLTC